MREIVKIRWMILVIRYFRKMCPTEDYLNKNGEKIERDLAYALQQEYSEKKISNAAVGGR